MPYPPLGETFIQKAKRKTVEEPLVPIGALATVFAVTMATKKFRSGDRTSMNQWLRVRVAAQGFTIIAICTYGFALRWRAKANEAGSTDANSGIENPGASSTGGTGSSFVGDIHVTPAALQRQAAKEKEKEDFEKRLEDAIAKDRVEENQKGKPDWKAAWKEGILRKNRENDAKRGKTTDKNE